MFRVRSEVIIRMRDGVEERDGDKGSLNMMASEWGMDVV